MTLNGSIGGGLVGLLMSLLMRRGTYDISYIVNSVLGGLTGITAGATVITPAESVVIGALTMTPNACKLEHAHPGAIGGAIAIISVPILVHFKIDDPVGASAVHLFAAAWGVVAVGICARDNFDQLSARR